MELINVVHAPDGEISDFNADLFIAATGYESRSICIPEIISAKNCKKAVIAYKDHKSDVARPANDNFFKENGYEFIYATGFEIPEISHLFNQFQSQEIKLMIDISVMTRQWYHSMLKFISELRGFSKITLKLVYCPTVFSERIKISHKIELKKLSMHKDTRISSAEKKPSALIMGLGNEVGISNKVYAIIKPAKMFLLHADPALNKEYIENIFINNHSLINLIPIKDLRSYPINNTAEIYSLLLDLILPLRLDYKIIIVPQGPKILALMSMILQMSYPDIELHFPHYKRKQIQDRVSFNDYTSVDLNFESE